MKVVSPNTRTTLVLNISYMPIFIATARMTMKHIIRNSVKSLDKDGNQFEGMEWFDKGNFFNDQPFMRSAGGRRWEIPTIVVTKANFWRNVNRRNRPPTLKELVVMYDYTCQITGKRYKKNWKRHFTREHVLPVAKGGSNDDFNLLLTCKEANALKGDKYPYFDVEGVNLEMKVKKVNNFIFVNKKEMREEWKQFPSVHTFNDDDEDV